MTKSQRDWLIENNLDPEVYDIDAEGNVFESPVMGKTEAFFRSAAASAVPAIASVPAGVKGFAAGAAAGSPLGPVGIAIGGISGALLAGGGTAYGVSKAQEALLEKYSPETLQKLAEGQREQPVASYFGGFAPTALTARPSVKGLAELVRPLQRGTTIREAITKPGFLDPALNVGVNVAQATGQQIADVAQGGEFSGGRLAADVALGTLFNRPTRLGRKLGLPEGPQEGPIQERNLEEARTRLGREKAEVERITGEMDVEAERVRALGKQPPAPEQVVQELEAPEQFFGTETEKRNRPISAERFAKQYETWWKSQTEPTEKLIREAAESVKVRMPRERIRELANDPDVARVINDPTTLPEFVSRQYQEGLEDAYESVGRKASSLTQEAQDLLIKVDKGGVPAFITNNLKRIATENGVTINASDTPDSVIYKLRQKGAAESEVVTEPASTAKANEAAQEIYDKLYSRLQREGDGSRITQEDVDFAARIASRRNLTIELDRPFAGSTEIRGIYMTDPNTGNRIVRVNPLMATRDTAIHEIGHDIFRGVTNPSMRKSLLESARGSQAYKNELMARADEVAQGKLTPQMAEQIALEEGLIQAFGEQVPNIKRSELRSWFLGLKASMRQLMTGKMSPEDAIAWMHYATTEAVPWNPKIPTTKAGEQRMQREQLSQKISSADTSLAQIPAVFKSNIFVPKGTNIDIGAGKFDLGKQYLESERGVTESVPFDPFNRSVESNRIAVERLQSGERFATATIPNVLNVIAENSIRDNVILQAARAIEPEGVAYFQIYEGDRSGNGRKTSKGFQNNKKTSDYVDEIRKHFDNVRTTGNIIVANNPRISNKKAFWQLSPDAEGPSVRYQRGPVDDTAYLKAVDKAVESGDMAEVQRMVDEAARKAGFDLRRLYHGTPFGKFSERANSINTSRENLLAVRAKIDQNFWAANDLLTEARQKYGRYHEQTKQAKELFDAASKEYDDIRQNIPLKEETGDVFRYVQAQDPGYLGAGFYFTADKNLAESYSKFPTRARQPGDLSPYVYETYLSLKNPYTGTEPIISPKTDIAAQYRLKGLRDIDAIKREEGRILRDRLIESGFDGVIRDYGEGTEYVAFYPEQIKSAEPITRDDAGNIIPLSQRFKVGSEDIRYQREETKTRKLAGRVAESETVPEEVRQTVRESPESQYETQNMAEVRDRTSTMSLSDLNADMIDQDSNTRVASGMEIFGRQIRSGDMLGASKTALALAKSGTTWGQLINQFKLLNSSTPEGLVRLVQQSMDKKKRGTMTDVQAAVLMDGMNRLKVADEQILVAQQAARAAFGSNDYAATIQSLKQLDLADAKRAEVDMFLNEAIAKINPADAADLFISMVQGSVMSPISIVRNVVGNLINYPLREIGDFGAYLIDGALSKDRNNSFNIRARYVERLKAFYKSLPAAQKVLLKGSNVMPYEVGTNIGNPLNFQRAWARIAEDLAAGKVGSALSPRNLTEATIGILPDIMLRLTQFTDVPFRQAERARIITELAKQRGLSDSQLQIALRDPKLASITEAEAARGRKGFNEDDLAVIESESAKAVFQQDNKGTLIASGINRFIRKEFGASGYIPYRLITLFQKTPINVAAEALQFTPAGALQNWSNMTPRERNIAASRIVLGTIATTAFGYLYHKGVMTANLDTPGETNKARELAKSGGVQPPGTLNLTALLRLLKGESSEFKPGDTVVDLSSLGTAGALGIMAGTSLRQSERSRTNEEYLTSMMKAVPTSGLNFITEQQFLKGASDFIKLLSQESTTSLDRLIKNYAVTAASPVAPAILGAIRRAERDKLPVTGSQSFITDTINELNQRYAALGLAIPGAKDPNAMPVRRDLWGEAVAQTPKGSNPWVYQFFNAWKARDIDADPLNTSIYTIWRRTADNQAIPSVPNPSLTYRQKTYERMSPEQFDRYSELVGKYRRLRAEQEFMRGRFQQGGDERKLKLLQRAYDDGLLMAKRQFLRELAQSGQSLTPLAPRRGFQEQPEQE